MKKNILSLLVLVMLMAMSSCEEPKHVAPTVNRQGITSLTAIFTSGPFVDKEMAKLQIGEDMPERLVIPIPWFYPTTSDDETTEYMTKVRVQAALAANCFIEPALTVLDLTKENKFTFIDAQGKSKEIIITGERVKSSACELMTFAINEPALSGIIDKTKKTVSLISADDLSAALASFEVSPHATISPDPSTEAINYNEPVTFTVTAHDGVTKAEYVVSKSIPEKIESGFNLKGEELLFNIDPVSNLGLPAYTVNVGPTLAAIQGKLIICTGTGNPMVVNGLTGVKIGELNLGSAVAGSVTNDEAEHLLIVNKANGNETVNIYTTSSVNETPELFYSFTNSSSLPLGAKIKVIGNIKENALISLVHEGVEGVTTSSAVTVIQVQNGAVLGAQVMDFSAAGLSWSIAPVNTGAVVPRTVNPADGCFHTQYGPSLLSYIDGTGTIVSQFNSDTTGWGLNPNCLDSKRFNNVNYLALFVVSHFPAWGMGPQLYVYNVNDMSKFAGSDITDLACLELTNQGIDWYQEAANGVASGDVVLAPSADGFKMYVYYYDHNSQVVGGYVVDCIKK